VFVLKFLKKTLRRLPRHSNIQMIM